MDDIPLTISLNYLWKRLFDKAFIISLDISTDRRDKIKNELERVGLENYEFRIFEKDREDTKRGCFISHQTVINECYNSSMDRVLILEDDAYFIKNLSKLSIQLEEIIVWLNNNSSKEGLFDVFFLGHLPIFPLEPVGFKTGIVKTKGSRYTHCYLLSREGMEKIIKIKYDGEHYDYYTGNFEKNFGIYPMISYQDDVISVNDYNFFYRLFSGVRNRISCSRLCRVAEVICYMKGIRFVSNLAGNSLKITGNIFRNRCKIFRKEKKEENLEYMDI